MKTRNLVVLGATALGIGAAAAGAYRATHPKDASGPPSPDPGRGRPALADSLFDLPAGVVNLLTGDRAELAEHFASHMDVNAIVYGVSGAALTSGGDREQLTKIQQLAAANVKRVIVPKIADYTDDSAAQSPYHIMDTQEIKTTWHPIGT